MRGRLEHTEVPTATGTLGSHTAWREQGREQLGGRTLGQAGSLPKLLAQKIYHLGHFLLFPARGDNEESGGEVAQNVGVIKVLIAEFKQRMQGSTYTVVPTEPREPPSMWVPCSDFFCQPHWINSRVQTAPTLPTALSGAHRSTGAPIHVDAMP